jgi:dipeptidase D
MDSKILKISKDLLSSKIGRSPGVKAIHAGLECGLLIEKMGGEVDALSFGPTITGAHSPDESINVETVPPFVGLVQEILAELAKKK